MTTQKKLVSALLVTALSAGTLNVAHAQDAEKPADTNVSASAEAADGKMKIAEIPVLEYTPKETQSPIKVNGTKDWDKALSLSPTENGDVTLNLNLGGQVPEGTKISLMDGSKELTSATVDSSGKVTLVAKDIPKQVKSLSLVASGDGVKGLQSVKCVADKGIDQKASEDATLEAIKKFETEYEEAWKNGGKGVVEKNPADDNNSGSKGGRVVTTTLPGEVVVTTLPGKDNTKVESEPGSKWMEPGKEGNKVNWKILGPTLGLAGGGILAGVLGPLIADFAAQLKIPGLEGLFKDGFNVDAILKQFQQIDLPGDLEVKLQKAFDSPNIWDGVMGLLDPNQRKQIEKVKEQIEGNIKKLEDQLKKAVANAEKQFNVKVPPQVMDFVNNFKLESLLPLLILPIVAGIIYGVVKSIEKTTGPGTEKEKPGTKTTKTSHEPGATVTTTLPGKVVTSTIPGEKVPNPDDNPGKPDLPTPPEFIEKELTKRDLPTKPEADGISFDIEVGSIVDCTAEVVPGDSTEKTPGEDKEKTTKKTKEKNTVRENETTNDKRSKKLNTCEDVREYAASNNIPGGVAGIKRDHPMFNAALDTDGNGIMCDENGNPVNRPVQSPVVSTPGIGGSKPVITPGSGAAPAQPVVAQAPAAPVMAAVPNYGPKVDTGAEIDKGFVRSALEFLSLR